MEESIESLKRQVHPMFTKADRERLSSLQESVAVKYGHERVLDLLSKENKRLHERLRAANIRIEKLLDRLMARDFESYATYKTEEEGETFSTVSNHEPLQDESNIGEVIEE